MRRIRLRTAMVAIAIFTIMLGIVADLTRRAQRLDGLAKLYDREAGKLEPLLLKPKLGRQEAVAVVDQLHWLVAVAGEYRHAAARPWLPFDPSPQRVTCGCS